MTLTVADTRGFEVGTVVGLDGDRWRRHMVTAVLAGALRVRPMGILETLAWRCGAFKRRTWDVLRGM